MRWFDKLTTPIPHRGRFTLPFALPVPTLGEPVEGCFTLTSYFFCKAHQGRACQKQIPFLTTVGGLSPEMCLPRTLVGSKPTTST